jgi:hypothetical protein
MPRDDRSYDDPNLPGVDGWSMGAGLQWTPTYLTSVYGRIDSSIEETTSQYSSGYFRTLYSLRVDHELMRSLQLSAFVSFSDNDYTLVPDAPPDTRSYDKVWRSGIGANWLSIRFMYLNASYDWEQVKTMRQMTAYRKPDLADAGHGVGERLVVSSSKLSGKSEMRATFTSILRLSFSWLPASGWFQHGRRTIRELPCRSLVPAMPPTNWIRVTRSRSTCSTNLTCPVNFSWMERGRSTCL